MTLAGTDYVAPVSEITFKVGEDTKFFIIGLVNDGERETVEDLTVKVGNAEAQVEITDAQTREIFAQQTSLFKVSEKASAGQRFKLPVKSGKQGLAPSFTIVGDKDVTNYVKLVGDELVTEHVFNLADRSPAQLSFEVQAKEGDLTQTLQVDLRVEDTNNHSPTFVLPATSSVELQEEQAANAVVTRLHATDADFGTVCTYSLVSQTTSGVTVADFVVNAQTGIVTTPAKFDFDGDHRGMTVTLQVQATDGDGRTADKTVTVTLVDINDNAPAFGSSTFVISVDENAEANTPVLSTTELAVTDEDTAVVNTAYTLNVEPDTVFGIGSNGLYIRSDGPGLDFERETAYTLKVTAESSQNPALQSSVSVAVTVNNLNDNGPVHTAPAGNVVAFDEDVAKDDVVYTPDVVDGDGTVLAKKWVWQLSVQGSQQLKKSFEIDAATGVISVTASSMDVDVKDDLNQFPNSGKWIIEGTDSLCKPTTSSAECSSYIVLDFVVNDINDNAPVFIQANPVVSISETYAGTEPVYTFIARDTDITRANDKIVYSIKNGGEGFVLDSATGALSASHTSALDVETYKNMEREVVVSGTDGLSSTDTTLKIVLTAENEFKPVFDSTVAEARVTEKSANGKVVATFTASDADVGAGGTLQYSVTEGKGLGMNAAGELVVTDGTLIDFDQDKEFTVQVTVTDGDNTATQNTNIIVDDVNDNKPQLNEPAKKTITVAEGSISRTLFQASDADDANLGNGQVRFVITGDSHGFKFEEATLVGPAGLDFESDTVPNTYSFTVHAEDGGSPALQSATSTTVTVEITNVNDNLPSFGDGVLAVVVNENEDGVVQTFAAKDADGDDVVYSIVQSSGLDFTIDSATGELSCTGACTSRLDKEQLLGTPLALDVVATEAGNSARFTQVRVPVSVKDVDEYGPECTFDKTSAEVNELAAVGKVVLNFKGTCIDKDFSLNGVIYSLAPGSNPRFSMNFGGDLVVASKLDAATAASANEAFVLDYVLDVVASSTGGLHTPKAITVSVSVIANNKFSPEFPSTGFNITAKEQAVPAGAAVELGSVAAEDLDVGANGEVAYTIVGGNTDGYFGVSASGMLQLVKSLDRDVDPATGKVQPLSKFTLDLRATDKGAPAKTASTIVVVTIDDVNDSAAQFDATTYTLYVSESDTVPHVITDSVFSEHVTDNDGAEANRKYTFSSDLDASLFNIESSSGELTLLKSVDYDAMRMQSTNPSFTFDLWTEQAGSLASDKVKVTVVVQNANDLSPVWGKFAPDQNNPHGYVWKMSEDAVGGSAVGTMKAVDPDSLCTIRYYFDDVKAYPDLPFAIDAVSGAMTIVGASDSKPLDRETIAEYKVNVRATDCEGNTQGLPVLESKVPISVVVADVNDQAPEFADSISLSVAENKPVGSVVGTVEATDDDLAGTAGARLSYTLTGDHTSLFDIDSSTGVVTTKEIFDRDCALCKTSYTVGVQAKDAGLPSFTGKGKFTVYISDAEDEPTTITVGSLTMPVEEMDAAQIVAPVSVADVDSSSNPLQVSIAVSPATGADMFALEADSAGGTDSYQLKTTKALNYEAASEYTVTVTVTTKTGLKTTATVTVPVKDVNDHAPVFEKGAYSFDVAENDDQAVLAIKANDEDGTQEFGTVAYYVEGVSSSTFSVGADGQIKLPAGGLDADTQATYTFNVTAQDSTGRADQTTVTITVIDVNDNDPEFDQSTIGLRIFEEEQVEAILNSNPAVLAKDKDVGNTGITYTIKPLSIAGVDYGDVFAINAKTGQLSIKNGKGLDADVDPYRTGRVEVEVTASDDEGKSTSVRVPVEVRNVNDNAPEWEGLAAKKPFYEGTVTENAIGEVLQVKAVSKDGGDASHNKIDYAIETNDASNSFKIDADGKISTVKAIDWETLDTQFLGYKNIVLTVTATDNGVPKKMATVRVFLKVIDVCDEAPKIVTPNGKKIVIYRLAEDTPSKALLPKLGWTDTDSSDQAGLSWSIENNPAGFAINNGLLSVTQKLDADGPAAVVILSVVATDCGGLTDTVQVMVYANDVNDNAPDVEGIYTMYVKGTALPVHVSENLETKVDVFKTTDKDFLESNQVTDCKIISGDSKVFGVEAVRYTTSAKTTCVLEVKKGLDREDKGSHTLVIRAINKNEGYREQFTDVDVEVIVDDVNDKAPTVPVRCITDMVNFRPIVYKDVDEEVKGAVVACIASRDVDDAQTDNSVVDFSVSGDLEIAPSLNADGSVRPNEAIVKFKDDAAADFESTAIIDGKRQKCFKVTVTDRGSTPLSSNNVICVDVEDKNDNEVTLDADPCVNLQAIPENSPSGTSVGKIAWSDKDTEPKNRLPFFLLKSSVPENAPFKIGALDGQVVTTKALSRFEVRGKYSITFTVRTLSHISGANFEQIYTCEIKSTNVNTYAPTTTTQSPDAWNVPENKADAQYTRLSSFTDNDGGALAFSFDTDKCNGTPAGCSDFAIEKSTGTITLAAALNREATAAYTLHVLVSDQGHPGGVAKTTPFVIAVTVIDVDDEDPVFADCSTPLMGTIAENAASGIAVEWTGQSPGFQPEDIIVDGDINAAFTTFKFLPGSSDAFSIGPETGVLTVKDSSKLDFERAETLTLNLEVVSRNNGRRPSQRCGSRSVQVRVLDVNEHSPKCGRNKFDLSEDADVTKPTGHNVVASEDASDNGDGGVKTGQTLRYTSDDAAVVIGLEDGSIRMNTGIKGRWDKPFTFDVKVYDLATYEKVTGGQPLGPKDPSFTVCPIEIKITDENDAPKITSSATCTVSEDAPVSDQEVCKVDSTENDDPSDVLSTIMYSVASGTPFKINPQTGAVRVAQELNYEVKTQYLLAVTVTDGGGLTDTQTLEVSVTDVDDVKPKFANQNTSPSLCAKAVPKTPFCFVVDEGVDGEIPGAQVQANDGDGTFANNAVTYSISDASGVFKIDPTTGKISIAQAVDFDTVQKLSAMVTASSSSLKEDVAVTFVVADVNDNAPILTSLTGEISEMAATGDAVQGEGTGSVLKFTGTDADASFANKLTMFAVKDATGTFGALALKGGSTGLQLLKELDGSTDSIVVQVKVTNPKPAVGWLAAFVDVTVAISNNNLNAPKFAGCADGAGQCKFNAKDSTFSLDFSESLAEGTVLATVTFTDADVGSNGKITFGPGNDRVEVVGTSGNGVAELKLKAAVDRENTCATDFGSIKVVARDSPKQSKYQKSGTSEGKLAVGDANDEPPKFNKEMYKQSVDESADASVSNPVEVHDFASQVSDGDCTKADLKLKITSGSSAFSIDGLKVMLTGAIDHESQGAIAYTEQLGLEITDGEFKNPATLQVQINNINDNKPVCSNFDVSGRISVSMDDGKTDAKFLGKCKDADCKSLSCKEDGIYYTIATTGFAALFDLQANGFRCVAGGDKACTGSNLGIVTKQPLNAEVYSTAQELTITAHDQDGLSQEYNVVVTVEDVDDVCPVFNGQTSYTFSEGDLRKKVEAKSALFTVDVTDGDVKDYKLTYSIANGNDLNLFQINDATGELTLTGYDEAKYERGIPAVSTLSIAVRDTACTVYEVYTVSVTDDNDNKPEFQSAIYKFSVQEYDVRTQTGHQGSSVMVVVKADDKDESHKCAGNPSYNVEYSLAGKGSELFTIGTYTGTISLLDAQKKNIDVDTYGKALNLVVTATDCGPAGTSSGSATVAVALVNINDNACQFDKDEYSFALDENLKAGSVIDAVSASDKDGDAVIYKLASAEAVFTINEDGIITTRVELNREKDASYVVRVTGQDNGNRADGLPLVCKTTVKITVQDKNDNKPIFTQAIYNVSLYENMQGTDAVTYVSGKIIVSDKDEGVNAKMSYTLSSPVARVQTGMVSETLTNTDYDTYFRVIPAAGTLDNVKLEVLKPLERELNKDTGQVLESIELTVTALNENDASMNATATIVVQVKDQVDFPPFVRRCKQDLPCSVTLNENAVLGTLVEQDVAIDHDAAKDIVYKIADVWTGPIPTRIADRSLYPFTINPDTGAVTTKGPLLDRDTEGSYAIDVFVEDKAAQYACVEKGTAAYQEENYDPNCDPSVLSYFLISQIKVTVVDLNDNKPVFGAKDPIAASVEEMSGNDGNLFSVTANDLDSDGNGTAGISFKILPGPGSQFFRITSQSAAGASASATVGVDAAMLDREKFPTITLTLEATDGGSECYVDGTATSPSTSACTETHEVVVTVLDVNDVTPAFSMVSFMSGYNGPVYATTAMESACTLAGFEAAQATLFLTHNKDAVRLAVNGVTNSAMGGVNSVALHDASGNEVVHFAGKAKRCGVPVYEDQRLFQGLYYDTRDIESSGVTVTGTGRNKACLPTGLSYLGAVLGDPATPEPVRVEFKGAGGSCLLQVSAGAPILAQATQYLARMEECGDNVAGVPTCPQDDQHAAIALNVAVLAEDADQPADNGKVKYSLVRPATSDIFQIDEDTGKIKVFRGGYKTDINTVDREAKDSYKLVVVATDQAGAQNRSSQTTVYVSVADVDDHSPVCESASAPVDMSELTDVGGTVATLGDYCSDKDQFGKNSALTFELIKNPGSDQFEVDSPGQLLKLREQFDSESGSPLLPQVTVQLQASGGDPIKNSKVFVIPVKIVNKNDNEAMFKAPAYAVTVDGCAAAGQALNSALAIMAIDKDQLAPLVYSVKGDGIAGMFAIDNASAAMSVATSSGDHPLSTYNEESYVAELFANDGNPDHTPAQASITVTVTDANNAPPKIKGSPVVTLHCDESKNPQGVECASPVLVISDDDVDAANRVVEFTMGKVGTDAGFEIKHDAIKNEFTVVVPKGTTDYEATPTGGVYKFDVTATNKVSDCAGNKLTSNTVGIEVVVLDLNDVAPQFAESVYAFTVPENAGQGTFVGQVKAIDGDKTAGVNQGWNQPRYDVDSDVFEIDTEGRVYVKEGADKAKLDRELASGSGADHIIELVVRAFDSDSDSCKQTDVPAAADCRVQGGGCLCTDMTVRIAVTDRNDNKPVFAKSKYTATLAEHSALDTEVVTVTAVDKDSDVNNGKVTYSLVFDPLNIFKVDGATGVVAVANPEALDFEASVTYSIIVKASDGAESPRSSTAQVDIKVTDTDDQTPKFTEGSYTASVAENSVKGTAFAIAGGLACTDGDTANTALSHCRYEITSPSSVFALDSITGELTVKDQAALNRETKASYTLKIGVFNPDRASGVSTADLVVSVTDMNDLAPTAEGFTPQQPEISEIARPGTSVTQAIFEDGDAGDNAKMTFAIDVTPAKFKAAFVVTPSGEILLAKQPACNFGESGEHCLDFEEAPIITIVVTATDGGSPSNSAQQEVTITVKDINDNSPSFSSGYDTTQYEPSAVGDLVTTIQATDKDKYSPASNSNSNGIVYQLMAGNVGGAFELDSASGKLTVNATLNRDLVSAYTLTVQATDGAVVDARSKNTTFTITVGDCNTHKPEFVKPLALKQAAECTATSGTSPCLDPGGGVDSANALYYMDECDFYSTGGQRCSGAGYTTLGSLTATDKDIYSGHNTFKYAIKTCEEVPIPGQTTEACPFKINENTGEVSVAQLDFDTIAKAYPQTTGGRFPVTDGDERRRSLAVSFTVTDNIDTQNTACTQQTKPSGGFMFELSLRNLNDEKPDMDMFKWDYEVPELSEQPKVGVTVNSYPKFVADPTYPDHRFVATDKDAGCYGKIRYTLNKPLEPMFSMNETTGALTIESTHSQYLQYATAPAETADGRIYSIYGKAEDEATAINTKDKCDASVPSAAYDFIIAVTVKDLNNQAPVFETIPTKTIQESAPNGTLIYTIKATDADRASAVTYKIASQTPAGALSIDEKNGQITLATMVDYEELGEDKKITAVIQALDGVHTVDAKFEVLVTDINDNSPVFTLPTPAALPTIEADGIDVNEDDSNFQLKFTATDADSSGNGRVSYTMTSVDDGNSFFQIDSGSGLLSQTASLDYDTMLADQKFYTLKVEARDAGTNPVSLPATLTFKLNVLNMNDEQPTITVAAGDQYKKIQERSDASSCSTINYVNTKQKCHAVISKINFKDADGLITDVPTCVDGSKPLTGSSVAVKDGSYINGKNEYKTFSAKLRDTYFKVHSETVQGKVEYSLITVTDEQGKWLPQKELEKFRGGIEGHGDDVAKRRNENAKFSLVLIPVDCQVKQNYPKTRIQAITVRVEVVDENNHVAPFGSATYALSLQEGSTVLMTDKGKALAAGDIQAVDREDVRDNTKVAYTIASVKPASAAAHLKIDPASGLISVAQEFDYQKFVAPFDGKITFTVQATDGKIIPAATAQVTITLSDTNNQKPTIGTDPAGVNYVRYVQEDMAGTPTAAGGYVFLRDTGGAETALKIAGADADSAATLTYRLDGFSSAREAFEIDGDGVITVKSTAHLDYDQLQQMTPPTDKITFSVTAYDGKYISAAKQVTIVVMPRNEHKPTFASVTVLCLADQGCRLSSAEVEKSTFSAAEIATAQNKVTIDVSETAKTNSAIAMIKAEDKLDMDGSNAATYEYSLSDATEFEFQDKAVGKLHSTTVFDVDGTGPTEYTLLVTVTETIPNRNEKQTSTLELTIKIIGADDNKPVFAQQSYIAADFGKADAASCRAGSADVCSVGSLAITIKADDKDEPNKSPAYSLRNTEGASVDALAYFTIDANGGITNTKEIDFEQFSSFSFLAVANEGANEATAPVTIDIFDVNDNKPVFTSETLKLSLTIQENVDKFDEETLSATAASVQAVDADKTNSTVFYSIEAVQPAAAAGTFAVDSATGKVQVKEASIDYEDFCQRVGDSCNRALGEVTVTLTVRATDGYHTSPNAATVVVTLQDMNDNRPTVRVQTQRWVEISEIVPEFTTIFAVTPEDEDFSDENSQVRLSVGGVSRASGNPCAAGQTCPWSSAFAVMPLAAGVPAAGVQRDIWLSSALAYNALETNNNLYNVNLWARNAKEDQCPQDIPLQQTDDKESTTCGGVFKVRVSPFHRLADSNDQSALELNYAMPATVTADLSVKVTSTSPQNTVVQMPAIVLSTESGSSYQFKDVKPRYTYSFEVSGELTPTSGGIARTFPVRKFEYTAGNFGPFFTKEGIKVSQTKLAVTYAPAAEPNGVLPNYHLCWCDIRDSQAPFIGGQLCCLNANMPCEDGSCSVSAQRLEAYADKNLHFVVRLTTTHKTNSKKLYAYSDEVEFEVAAASSETGVKLSVGAVDEENNQMSSAGIAAVVILIFIIIVIGIMIAWQYDASQNSKKYEIQKDVDVENAPQTDEERIDALKGKIFEDSEDNKLQDGPVLPQATEKQEKYYDYFAAQRQNAFLGAGSADANANAPQYGAGGYLDINPYASPGDKKGGSGGVVRPFDTNGPVEVQTMQQTRQDSFQLAFAARAQTGSTIPAAEVVARIEDMKRRGTIDAEFAQIKADTMNFPVSFTASQEQFNLKKNRYLNVKPLDSTRVKLSHSGTLGGDYINGNYVSGWQQPNAYIATQGPIPGTFNDFWRMIWEENCGVIVMVTKETEMGKRKCDKYWPDEGKPLQCGTLEVIYRDYDVTEDLVVRRMTIRSSIFNETREVVQYQVKSWPDQGVPENGGKFLELIHSVRDETQAAMARGQNGPVVTHCSAGIGRTGTFIAVDISLRRLLAAGNIDLLSTVNHMRQQRVGSVQTIAQYRFCYDAIQQYVTLNGVQPLPTAPSPSDDLTQDELNVLDTLAGYDDAMSDEKLLEQLKIIINQ